MAGVTDNIVPVGSETFYGVLISKHELTIQPCTLGVLMMACRSQDVKNFGNSAGQMPVVVCKSLGSDKDLDHIYHLVVLHPECGVLPPSASRLKVSSNLCFNTTGSVYLAPIFPSATLSMKVLMSQGSSSVKASFMMCC